MASIADKAPSFLARADSPVLERELLFRRHAGDCTINLQLAMKRVYRDQRFAPLGSSVRLATFPQSLHLLDSSPLLPATMVLASLAIAPEIFVLLEHEATVAARLDFSAPPPKPSYLVFARRLIRKMELA
jgi:hypothetical protein